MRVAFLLTRPAGYQDACIRVFAKNYASEIFLSRIKPAENIPFSVEQFLDVPGSVWYEGMPETTDLLSKLERFRPQVLFVISWHVPAYRMALKKFSGSARILFMDNPWLGTLKQWGGRLASRWMVRSLYDAVFLPGERQAVFARMLGFTDDLVVKGGYSCDYSKFSVIYSLRGTDEIPRTFLVVARLVEAKGIDVLATAWQAYCARSSNPWSLVVCGRGELEKVLRGLPGVELKGFVQPNDLPEVMRASSCLVLPSRFEPWGVVVHEATTAGLGVICTEACGASDMFVTSGMNGAVVPPGRANALAEALAWYSTLSKQELIEVSRVSKKLAAQMTPEIWAENLRKAIDKAFSVKVAGSIRH